MDVKSRALEDQDLFPFTLRTGNLSPGKQYARPGSLHVRIGSHRFCRSLRCLFGCRHGANHSFGPSRWCVGRRGNPKTMMVGLDLASGTLTLLATLLVGRGYDLPVLCATLILLSILGSFETPVAQACLPLLLQGESLVRGNAAVNQVSAVSSLAGPFLGSLAYSSLGLQPVLCSQWGLFSPHRLVGMLFAASCFSPSHNWQRRNMGHYQGGSSRLYPPHLPRAAHVAPSPTPDLCLGLFCPENCPGGPSLSRPHRFGPKRHPLWDTGKYPRLRQHRRKHTGWASHESAIHREVISASAPAGGGSLSRGFRVPFPPWRFRAIRCVVGRLGHPANSCHGILCVRPVPASRDDADSHACKVMAFTVSFHLLCPTTGPDFVWRSL